MRLFSVVTVLVCSLLISASAFASVIVTVPKTVKILAVNGNEVSVKQRVNPPNGLCQIVFRVDTELAGSNVIDGEKVRSDVFILKFEATDERVDIKIPEIKRKYDLDKFNKDPDIQLVSSKGGAVPYDFDRLKKDGFQLMRDYEAELASYNQTDAPAAVRLGETATVPTVTKNNQINSSWDVERQSQPASDQSVTDNMLKYWYQQADDETRQKFLEWISE